MVRLKEYSRHDVLDKAIGLFCEKGYKASSMTDIVRVTGLNTASMYKEFGDKDGLFIESLEHYRDITLAPRIKLLIDEPNLKGVKTCLEDIIDGTKSDDFMGCLMMNHLTQKKSISAKVNKIITDFCSDMEKLFETALRNAQANGEIPLSKEPAELASVVMFFIHGFVLYGRHQNVENKMPKFYEIVMQTLQN